MVVQTTPGPGKVFYDHPGSIEEDYDRVVADLIRRFTMGLGGIGSDDPELGKPSMEDYASGANGGIPQASAATIGYWEKFVAKYRSTDPFMLENYGPPPTRHATPVNDPEGAQANRDFLGGQNALDRELDREKLAAQERLAAADRASQEGIAAAERIARENIARMQEEGETARLNARIAADREENERNRTFQSGESALDRAFREAEATKDRSLALERETRETDRVRMGIESDEKIALMQDVTRRYEAEGTWGVQRYIAELQEKGALERLTLQLNLQEKELAQDAEGERNRHHETMVGLVFEVAKYDSELAAEPTNWLKYAAWLDNRGVVVNGMTLSMASQTVPEDAIGGEDLASSQVPGATVAAIQTPAPQAVNTGAGDPNANAGQQAAMAASTQATTAQPGQPGYTYKGIDLENRNYGQLLDQILGLNPNAAQPGVDNSPENIQRTLNSLNTTGHEENPGGQQGGFALNGSMFNFDPRGQKQDYRKFRNLLPTQQKMAAGAAQAAGTPIDDFIYKMERSRPSGGNVGATAYG